MGSGCCSGEKLPDIPPCEKPADPPRVRSPTPPPKLPVERVRDPTPPPPPKVIHPVRSCRVKPPERPEIFREDFIIGLLISSAYYDTKKGKKIEKKLQGVVKDVVKCTDPDQCQAFIDDVKDEKIFLVISELMMDSFVVDEQNDSKIEAIYYLNSKAGEEDDEEYEKLTKTNDNEEENDELGERQSSEVSRLSTPASLGATCVQIKKDVKISGHNLIKPQVIESKAERIRLMYNQLFRDVILETKEEELDDFFKFCEQNYSKNQDDNMYANLRSSYSKDKAIVWYTAQGCLYRMANKALRTIECDTLYELRHFIRHVHENLVDRQPKQVDWKGKTFHRGQHMDLKDFNHMRDNQGKFTFFPNFLSTSSERNEAWKFIEKNHYDPRNKGKVAVMFKIIVKDKIYSPFANVEDESIYKDEKEWLFSLGSVFSIDEIKEDYQRTIKYFKIKLTSIKHHDEELAELKNHYKRSVMDDNIRVSFGRLLYQMAEWEKAKKIYYKASRHENIPYRQAAIQSNIGLIDLKLEKGERSLTGYDEFLADESEGDPAHRHRAMAYNNIATVFFKDKQFDSAAKNLRLAIQAYNEQPNGDLSFIATVYNNMACILNCQCKHELALANNEKCLGIRQVVLPPVHPDLAIAYNSIAITCRFLWITSQDKGHYAKAKEYAEKAVEYAQKAVKMDTQSVLPEHPQLKTHMKNLEYLESQKMSSEQV